MYLPAVQLALNSRITYRHGSTPFAVMFARKLNEWKSYSGEKPSDFIKEADMQIEDLIQRNQKMAEIVFPGLLKKSEENGQCSCAQANAHRKQETPFAIGTKVMLRNESKPGMGETRSGPFTVVSYEKKSSTYQCTDQLNALLNRKFVHKQLDVISYPDDIDDLQGHSEVKEITDHRGPKENREYYVTWKAKDQGPEESRWVKAKNFSSTLCIREYWSRANKGKPKSTKQAEKKKATTKKKKAPAAAGEEVEQQQEPEDGGQSRFGKKRKLSKFLNL